MILLIFILSLTAFFQTSVGLVDLVVLVLIAYSFTNSSSPRNYYLSFLMGLLISFLSNQPLGFLSVEYLLIVKSVDIFKNLTTFSSNWFFLIPFSFLLLLLYNLLSQLILRVSFDISVVILETILVLPLTLVIRLFHDRFKVDRDLRLKIRK